MLRVCNGPDRGKRVLQVHELGSTPVLSPNCVVPFFFFFFGGDEWVGFVLLLFFIDSSSTSELWAPRKCHKGTKLGFSTKSVVNS